MALSANAKCGPARFADDVDWSAYLRRVYRERVPRGAVRIEGLEFFYHGALPCARGRGSGRWPCGICVERLPDVGPVTLLAAEATGARQPPLGHAWAPFRFSKRGFTPGQRAAPQPWTPRYPGNLVATAGFFVRRQRPLELRRLARLEVLHVGYPSEYRGTAWFWPAAGTGVFVELAPLRALGSVAEVGNRTAWTSLLRADEAAACTRLHLQTRGQTRGQPSAEEVERCCKFPAGGSALVRCLDRLRISALLIRGGSVAGGVGSGLVGEFVVASRAAWSEQPEAHRRREEASPNCPLPDRLLSTGYTEPRACVCVGMQNWTADGEAHPNATNMGVMNCWGTALPKSSSRVGARRVAAAP